MTSNIHNNGGYIGINGEFDLGGIWKFSSSTKKIVENGLILHYDTGNRNSYPGSGTTLIDRSPTSNNATISGGAVYDSANNRGIIKLDGSDDVIVTALNLSSYTSLTIDIWYFDERSNVGEFDILTYGDSRSFTFRSSDTSFRTDQSGIGARYFSSVNVPSSNVWINLTYVKNGNLYINGTEYATGGGLDRPYQNVTIAGNRVAPTIRGKFAIFRVYDRSLTKQEIQQNYAATRVRFA